MFNANNSPDVNKISIDRDDSRSNPLKNKPDDRSNKGKDFKKILSDKEQDSDADEQDSERLKKLGENTPTIPPVSLFDLSAKMQNAGGTGKAAIAAKQGKASKYSHEDAVADEFTQRKKFASRAEFAREQPDISSVNPINLAIQTDATDAEIKAGEKFKTIIQSIKALVDQLVDNIHTLKMQGKLETVIMLKQPPLFEGVSLTVTSFDSAKGEFNIAFHNLTQAAKEILDAQQNKNTLQRALDEKGYTVHIVITSTAEIEQPRSTEAPRFAREDNNQESDQRQQQEDESG